MYSAYVLCACFASVNCGPRTAVAGVVGEYSRGRNSFLSTDNRYVFGLHFASQTTVGSVSLHFVFVSFRFRFVLHSFRFAKYSKPKTKTS